MTERLEAAPGTWRRVSRRYVLEVLGETILAGLVAAAAVVVLWLAAGISWFGWLLIPVVAVAVAVILVAGRRVAAIGYRLREDDLLFRRGILLQRFVAVPYGRMQLIDIDRDPLARLLGLSELKFVTAAASTGISIPGLPEAEARELRDRLVGLAESRRTGL